MLAEQNQLTFDNEVFVDPAPDGTNCVLYLLQNGKFGGPLQKNMSTH